MYYVVNVRMIGWILVTMDASISWMKDATLHLGITPNIFAKVDTQIPI